MFSICVAYIFLPFYFQSVCVFYLDNTFLKIQQFAFSIISLTICILSALNFLWISLYFSLWVFVIVLVASS